MAALGAAEDDTEAVRLQKQTFVLATVLYAVLGTAWGTLYLALGLPLPALIPYGYVVGAGFVLAFFAVTAAFAAARTTVLLAWLLLPLTLQLVLGGFVPASAVVLWSLAAPLGALIFSRKESAWWATGFVVVVAGAWLAEPFLEPRPGLTPEAVSTFFALNLGGVGLAVFFIMRDFLARLDEARAALRLEQERSERLLLNVLPEPIARRLKEGEELIADRLGEVSIVFADLVGFTAMSERLPAEQVVAVLDGLFAEFDLLADELGMEKIRTIGDNYMVVAGAPHPRSDHVAAAADMALAMRDIAHRHLDPSGAQLEVRIGIDCGPVVAGVIGRHKFVYDVWGDSVNTASRMESHGEPGRIQVTPSVYQRLRDAFRFEERGVIEVKGKGPMTTYFLLGRR